MSPNAPRQGFRRRSLLGAAFVFGLGSAAGAAPPHARSDLLARLGAVDAPADDEHLVAALRTALVDVQADSWRGTGDEGRTTLWTRGVLRLDRLTIPPRGAVEPMLVTDRVTVALVIGGLGRFAYHEPVEATDGDVFVVRRTREGVLTPGRLVDATPARDTIRGLRAGHEGLELLELVARRGPVAAPRHVDVAATAFDAFAGLHAARWAPPTPPSRPR